MPIPTTDFSIFDGQELVTYMAVSGPTLEDLPALRRPLTQSSQRNVERYVELEAGDVIIHLDAANLDGTALAAGDTIVDRENMFYEVLFVEHQTLDNTVAVVARPTS